MNTHQINPHSTYSKGHLDPENHKNVMNCTYYIVFEQNYKNVQWWNVKKARIQKQIADNDQKQMKVNILTVKVCAGNFCTRSFLTSWSTGRKTAFYMQRYIVYLAGSGTDGGCWKCLSILWKWTKA